jgi:glycosyltransferase involved in cell wall biosynthesis
MDMSVIVPCRNEERHIARCLEALLAQSIRPVRYEIILADNMSTDRSVEIARRYPRVTVVQQTKLGSYAARNAGARLATGRILAFTDADCVACQDWLERSDAELADGATTVVLGGRRFGNEGLVLRGLADYESEKARFVFSQDDAALYYAYTNNMAVRRDAFERCGPFVEIARGGDVVFISRVTSEFGCRSVRFVPEMLVRHLEIDRWYSWHRKMWIYGGSYQRYRSLSRTRPLSYANRFAILRNTARRGRFPLLRGMLLLLSGVMATLAYEAGRLTENRRARSGRSPV